MLILNGASGLNSSTKKHALIKTFAESSLGALKQYVHVGRHQESPMEQKFVI